jgi:hypothetical protein
MSHRRKLASRRGEGGFAMIAIITLVALMSSYFIASALSRTTADIQIERSRKTTGDLQEAKAALLAYMANQAFTDAANAASSTSFQPGALPCPNRNATTSTNDDGTAESTCTAATDRVGRFPWKTVNASEFRDGSGEHLWYAISSSFQKAYGTTIINVDTPGTLSVSGAFSATDVVAVIFAPGAALSTQARTPATSGWNSVSNFLDGGNADVNDEAFFAASARTRMTIGGTSTFVTPYETDCATNSPCLAFNDQLVVVTRDELFQAVEAAVPAMLQQLISGGQLSGQGYLEYYRATWGRYPFPAQFSDPTTSNYVGTYGQTSGLLPVSSSSTYLTWKTPSTAPSTSSITLSSTGATTGSITPTGTTTAGPVTCSLTSSTQVDCAMSTWTNRPTLRVDNLFLNNAGQLLADGLSSSQITLINNNCNKSVTGFSATHSLAPYQSGSAYTYGSITPTMRLPSHTGCSGTTTLRITVPSYLAMTSSTDTYMGWLQKNNWHRYFQYSVAPGWLPNSSVGSCTAGTDCLTANNLPTNLTPANDKRVLMVFSGRRLSAESSLGFAAQSHPSALLTNYFEQQNATTGDSIFDHKASTSSKTFNDRVVVVAP